MLLVQNDEKLVYKVEMEARQASEFYYLLKLELVAGWDYGEVGTQGYVKPEHFVDDVQFESYTFHPIEETIIGRLEDAGYKRITVEELQIANIESSL